MKKSLKVASLILCISLLLPIFITEAAFEPIAFTEIETVEAVDFRYEANAIPLATEVLVAEVSNEYERYGKLILSQMPNSTNLLKAYEIMADGVANLSSKIYLTSKCFIINNSKFIIIIYY